MKEALSYLADYEDRVGSAPRTNERPPADDTSQLDPEARREKAWASLCRILLASNEFIYMD